MSERPRYSIELIVRDLHSSGGPWGMSTSADEFPIFSDRFVDEVRAPIDMGVGLVPFDTIVRTMKKREFRREYLLHAAKALAGRLANYIEDSEGWHGDRRRRLARGEEEAPEGRGRAAPPDPL